MDLSSGIAVYALDVQPGDHVLDICCAPGKKYLPENYVAIGIKKKIKRTKCKN